jgi:glycosyltransferase involved in cell wall biosynthesis
MSNLGFQNNIFIPNMYTFDKDKTPLAELKNHNIMMLGRLNDKKKGVIFAVKAMEIIVKEIPDAKLNLISSDSKDEKMEQTIKKLNLNNNIKYIPFTKNIEKYFLDSSVFFFPSLTEAFPMALNEAKAYGVPCVGFNIDYSVPYRNGIIKVEMFDYKGLANEIIKLLKNYDYRIKMGKEAKESLSMFNNERTTKMWGKLFNTLNTDEKNFQRFRKNVKRKFYNEQVAKHNLEKQFGYIKQYNKFFSCFTLDDFTDIKKLNDIKLCENVTLL